MPTAFQEKIPVKRLTPFHSIGFKHSLLPMVSKIHLGIIMYFYASYSFINQKHLEICSASSKRK